MNNRRQAICSKCSKIANPPHIYDEIDAWRVKHPPDMVGRLAYAVMYGRLYCQDFDEDACLGCKQMMVFTSERLGLLMAKLGVRLRDETK